MSSVASPRAASLSVPADGIGWWKMMRKSYTSPINAVIDLVDNCVDAAFDTTTTATSSNSSEYRGSIDIEADTMKTAHGDADTGLRITNSCFSQTRCLKDVLTLFSSAKGHGRVADDCTDGSDTDGQEKYASTIGENGIGLKQASAFLSDLSIVFTCNNGKLSFGLIARSLCQDGPWLPSFDMRGNTEVELREELSSICTGHIGEVVVTYGDGSLVAGIERILTHLLEMCSLGNQYSFRVVLHDLLHDVNAPLATTGRELQEGLQEKDGTKVDGLLNAVKARLPRQYLCIPDDLDFRVGSDKLQFCYWQKKLVELTVFECSIDKNMPYGSSDNGYDWKHPSGPEVYRLRIYCGFNPEDVRDKGGAKLFIYSRSPGRLMKSVADCRGSDQDDTELLKLDLCAPSGSNFAQGLTIIVDDMEGHFVLNPQKESLLLGSKHYANLKAWIAAKVRLYYLHHLSNHGEKKTALSDSVSAFKNEMPSCANEVLRECDLTRFELPVDSSWYIRQGKILLRTQSSPVKVVNGTDALWRLPNAPADLEASGRKQKRSRRTNSPQKRSRTDCADEVVEYESEGGSVPSTGGEDDERTHTAATSSIASSPTRASRGKGPAPRLKQSIAASSSRAGAVLLATDNGANWKEMYRQKEEENRELVEELSNREEELAEAKSRIGSLEFGQEMKDADIETLRKKNDLLERRLSQLGQRQGHDGESGGKVAYI